MVLLVKAMAVNVKTKGARTLLSIRPERVAINPGAGRCDVVMKTSIAELIYLGDHIRVRRDVAGQHNFVVKVPHTANTDAIRQAKSVNVGWSVKDWHTLDELPG